MQANTIIIANGTPVIMTDVWSAVKPPANIRTAATTPSKIAQVTLDTRGELSLISVWLLDESIEATNDPESEEVTKKVIIKAYNLKKLSSFFLNQNGLLALIANSFS